MKELSFKDYYSILIIWGLGRNFQGGGGLYIIVIIDRDEYNVCLEERLDGLL